jgi:hypothetical protein
MHKHRTAALHTTAVTSRPLVTTEYAWWRSKCNNSMPQQRAGLIRTAATQPWVLTNVCVWPGGSEHVVQCTGSTGSVSPHPSAAGGVALVAGWPPGVDRRLPCCC